MKLQDRKEYYQQLSPEISGFVNSNHPRYLWLFLIYLPTIIGSFYLISFDYVSVYVGFFLSMIAGLSFGGLMLLGHEISHKCVIKSKWLIWLLSTLCMSQFGMTATVWDRWHNRLHHVFTQVPFEDPDSWGYEKLYRFNWYFRYIFKISPGSRKFGSIFFLFIYFSWQSFMAVFLHPKVLVTISQKVLNRSFFVLIYAAWISIASMKGIYGVFTFFVIPLAFSNLTMMMYISTNHFLSRINPLDGPNDTLLNTLSVIVPKWMDFFHLNISYHVEHHLFPYISSHHYPEIQKIVQKKYPLKYMRIPLFTALKEVYLTPRFYLNTKTLIHPETRKTSSTLR